MGSYLEAVREELSASRHLLARPLDTIYLGGGTPTILPANLLLDLASELGAMLGTGGELTVEANPGTIDESLTTKLLAAGVTRLSLGVQSFSPRLREQLGRKVTQQELEVALAALKAVGPPEWSLDLIYGIPGQNWDELMEDLDCAIEAMPPHISMYDLTYTPSYSKRVRHLLGDKAAEEALAFAEASYAEACQRLVAAGYRRYEVSNFALPGHECRHNQAYWNGADYLGLGASAVSTVGSERRSNPASAEAYLGGESPSVEVLDEQTKLWERAMLGLRTAAGVEEEAVSEVLVPAEVERLVAGGYLERHCGKLRVNAGFLDVSNSLISAVLTGR